MDKLDKKSTNRTKTKDKKSLNSNPISKAKIPADAIKMISVPKKAAPATETPKLKETKQQLENTIKPISITEDTSLDSIVETINNFNTSKTRPRMYADKTYNATTNTIKRNVNYFEIMTDLSDAFNNNKNMVDLFGKLTNIFIGKLQWNFAGFGLFHEKSKCINLKLFSKTGNTYTSKVFLSDEYNPIIECFNSKETITKDNINYLNIPYLVKTSSVIVPMISVNKCIGIMIIGQSAANINTNLSTFIANYMGMYIHNLQLQEQTNKFANTDNLTSLYNHRGFQEVLAKELAKAKDSNTPLSVVMFDVNNISKINRELGHAKGDEVIKTIAEKIKQNIRANDSAGR